MKARTRAGISGLGIGVGAFLVGFYEWVVELVGVILLVISSIHFYENMFVFRKEQIKQLKEQQKQKQE